MIYIIWFRIVREQNLSEIYNSIRNKDYSYFSSECLDRYFRILKEDIRKYSLDEIESTGFVIDTLAEALWWLLTTESYSECIIKAINLGNDTDTVAACTVGLARIKYGVYNISKDWKKDLIKREYIEELCDKLDNI